MCATFIVMAMMAMSVTGNLINKLEYFKNFYSYKNLVWRCLRTRYHRGRCASQNTGKHPPADAHGKSGNGNARAGAVFQRGHLFQCHVRRAFGVCLVKCFKNLLLSWDFFQLRHPHDSDPHRWAGCLPGSSAGWFVDASISVRVPLQRRADDERVLRHERARVRVDSDFRHRKLFHPPKGGPDYGGCHRWR